MLWQPDAGRRDGARVTHYLHWLAERGLAAPSGYHELWQWSVEESESFWTSLIGYFDVDFRGEPTPALASSAMPGASWFPNLKVNYARSILGGRDPEMVAIRSASELRALDTCTWGELTQRVACLARGLRAAGVQSGDRVAAYLPNIVEAVAAFLATASIGAIWSSCSPDFGVDAVVDRFAQIAPKVLLAVDGYRYGGRDFSRMEQVSQIQQRLPSLERTVLLGYLDPAADPNRLDRALAWAEFERRADVAPSELPEYVAFDHPLWILYSSGTTGLPKPIVHGHGGILLEHLKSAFQLDAAPGDRFFWFTTTGWMMWNATVGALLSGAEIVLYDGNPNRPEPAVLWKLRQDAGITIFGTSPTYLTNCLNQKIVPNERFDLSRLRTIGSTGSPLSAAGFRWVYRDVGPDVWLTSISGGTDICGSFAAGAPVLPVVEGRIQGRALGASVEAWTGPGEPVIGDLGELVVTRPMPSMPLYFWGDEDGARYRESYFEMFPGFWRHGDWIEIWPDGSVEIAGRSDSTINRGGVRMGTSEIYRRILSFDEIDDALVVDVPKPDSPGWMVLFLVLAAGVGLDADLAARTREAIRKGCSPRHVPDAIFAAPDVPRTISGKLLEVPIRKILLGTPVSAAVTRGALANPQSLDWYVNFAASLAPTASD